jgi:type II secretory pathway component GspD/PulD (secretin)
MARTSFSGPIQVGQGSKQSVTQTTDRSTGVTINAVSGQIVTDATSLAAGAEASFVVTNSKVRASSVPVIAVKGGQTATTSVADVIAVADGSFTIQLTNLAAATADTGAMTINFIVFDAPAV